MANGIHIQPRSIIEHFIENYWRSNLKFPKYPRVYNGFSVNAAPQNVSVTHFSLTSIFLSSYTHVREKCVAPTFWCITLSFPVKYYVEDVSSLPG